MDRAEKVDEVESSAFGIFELPGESVVIINGVPPSYPRDGDLVACDVFSDEESHRNTGFGEWLVGRNVKKFFRDQFYNGKVIGFDEEMGWYKVVYEDGDIEDLEWHELERVLQPLDMKVPLDTIAVNIIKRGKHFIAKSKNVGARTRDQSTQSIESEGNVTEVEVEIEDCRRRLWGGLKS